MSPSATLPWRQHRSPWQLWFTASASWFSMITTFSRKLWTFLFNVCPTDNLTGDLCFYRLFVLCVAACPTAVTYHLIILWLQVGIFPLLLSIRQCLWCQCGHLIGVYILIYGGLILNMTYGCRSCVYVMWHADWLFLMYLFCFVSLSALQGSLSLAAIQHTYYSWKIIHETKNLGF